MFNVSNLLQIQKDIHQLLGKSISVVILVELEMTAQQTQPY